MPEQTSKLVLHERTHELNDKTGNLQKGKLYERNTSCKLTCLDVHATVNASTHPESEHNEQRKNKAFEKMKSLSTSSF